jgi:hypothetical protein
MLNFFMPCFGSHFENGRHLENFENAELLLLWWPITMSNFMSLWFRTSISTSWIDCGHRKISTGRHFQNGHHNTSKIQHCSISKVAFNLFFKLVVSGWFGRLHNR